MLPGARNAGSGTYVIRTGQQVVRYCAPAPGAVSLAHEPGRVQLNMPDPVRVRVIGRLAVHKNYQGRRSGRVS